jgi:DNA-binding MarR family transcriptional regulator
LADGLSTKRYRWLSFAYVSRAMANSSASTGVRCDVATPDPVELQAAWGALVHLFLSQEAQWVAEGDRLGLTPPQIRLIMIVRNDDTLLMRDLAAALGVGKPYVTALVRQLEDAGYLTTHPSPIDRRAKILTVTRRGANACRTLEAALLRLPRAIEALDPVAQWHLVALTEALQGPARQPSTRIPNGLGALSPNKNDTPVTVDA